MKTYTQRWIYFRASLAFEKSCAFESTRHCSGNLSEATGELTRLISDAYLMGGEL